MKEKHKVSLTKHDVIDSVLLQYTKIFWPCQYEIVYIHLQRCRDEYKVYNIQ